MKYDLLIVTLVLVCSCVTAASISDDDDDADEWIFDCSMTVSAKEWGSSFIITNKGLIDCSEASIFWSYPLANMTIKFSADQQLSKAFNLCITDTQYLHKDMPLYRLLNGQEILVDTTPDPVCFQSDSNNQVILKSIGPERLKYYGESFNYNIKIN